MAEEVIPPVTPPIVTPPTPDAPVVPPVPAPETPPPAAPPETILTPTPKPDAPVVPEKYDLKLEADSLLDAKAMERITSHAKKQGLTNEQAQMLLNDESKAVAAYVNEQSKQWITEASNDAEIGGEKFKENVTLAQRVIARFGTDALKAEFNRFGYGNHPELVRLFCRIGKGMAEDQLVIPGQSNGVNRKSAEEILYPDMFKKVN